MNIRKRLAPLAVTAAIVGGGLALDDVADASATSCSFYGMGTNFAGIDCNAGSSHYLARVTFRYVDGNTYVRDGPVRLPSGPASMKTFFNAEAIAIVKIVLD